MAEQTLTNVPVYRDKEILGILSDNSYLKWLSTGFADDGFILSETNVGDIAQFLDKLKDDHSDNEYMFIKPSTDVFTIQDMFNSALERGKRLSAIFVTNTGKETESLLGIITAWDFS